MLVDIIVEELDGVPGLRLVPIRPNTVPNFWQYPLTLDPEKTDKTATEFAALCTAEHGVAPHVYNEVNYLEVVYQEMNRDRRTCVGVPLPDHIRYEPGICPVAEESAMRVLQVDVHHGVDADGLRTQVRAIVETARKHL
ncbi:MAG: hypothetical protein HQ559_05555 [Lentisphaerae bacterium]|nr:hypothetical protein [Lentisphaerota bacterium]